MLVKTIKGILLSLCMSLIVIAGSTSAQEVIGFTVTRVEVKAGAGGQFENFIRQFKAAAEEVNWAMGWTASQVAVGNTSRYLFVAPFTSHSQLATPVTALLAQAHSPAEAAEIVQELRDSTESLVTGTYYPRSDLSNAAEQALPNPELFITIGVDVNPGSQLAYESWVHRVVDASEGISWNGFIKRYGEGPDYVFRTASNWTDLDQAASSPQQRILETFGAVSGNNINDNVVGAMSSANYSLVVDRPELSYTP